MPRAEVGSTKHLSNKMKSKGLQRLRWYCQVCERQMRDENGFKCHVQSESHVRQMLLVGEDPKKHIARYSEDFKRDFLQLLRTSHGEKLTNLNHFYQEYIANKEHVHMNATKWPSLTEFAKYLGREGICRVEDVEGKGLHVGWIDNSPEALRRQDAIRAKERQDRGDEEREQRLIRQQVEKAQQEAKAEEEASAEARQLQREEGEKITLNFGAKPAAAKPASPSNENGPTEAATPAEGTTPESTSETAPASAAPAVKMSLNMGAAKPKNVFAAAKKNPLAAKKAFVKEPPKKMSEAERIMKEEIERKRAREAAGPGQGGFKRQKVA
ncbi:hypothetical protein W97_05255 [Coniosporium apollinis CBS 100218]|uniref:C2H2-type domain-containing protein n=1 Tax=Coniosporium apollinis (strain CBS 100218) TaxID=1168221 RepID=R7YVU1_CONA1|nr:uncharacterized protein W97_05255 [Coniosporium apollinis CBS 100218]EON66012.1 hypothetical protein W97_05255 [Coniosporium apollinis CBS 100218]